MAHGGGHAECTQGANDGTGDFTYTGASADVGGQLRCVGHVVFVLRLHADIHEEKG
jgi:hypothetical protein